MATEKKLEPQKEIDHEEPNRNAQDDDTNTAVSYKSSTDFLTMEDIAYEDLAKEPSIPKHFVIPPVASYLTTEQHTEFRLVQLHVHGKVTPHTLSTFGKMQYISLPIIEEADAKGKIILPIGLRVIQTYNTAPFALEWKFQSITTPLIVSANSKMNYQDKELLPPDPNPKALAAEIASLVKNTESQRNFSLENVLAGLVDVKQNGEDYHASLRNFSLCKVPANHPYYFQIYSVAEEMLKGDVEIAPNMIDLHKGGCMYSGVCVRDWRKNKQIISVLLDMKDLAEGWKTAQTLIEIVCRIIEIRLIKNISPLRKQPTYLTKNNTNYPTIEESTQYWVQVRRFNNRSFADFDGVVPPDSEFTFGVYYCLFFVLVSWPRNIKPPSSQERLQGPPHYEQRSSGRLPTLPHNQTSLSSPLPPQKQRLFSFW